MEKLIKELISLIKEKELVEADIKAVKAKIEEQLPEDGYKDANVTITRTTGSTMTSINLEDFEKAEPSLYDELLKCYPKITTKKGSISYRFKK